MLLIDAPNTAGEVYNVGNHEETSMNRLAELVTEMAGSSSGITHVPYDVAYEVGFEDMERRVPDITKILNAVDWEPTLTLEQMISDVLAFERGRTAPSGEQ